MTLITGCAYYPEHWPAERWASDAQAMRDAGLDVVRLAEFAWDKLEPEPGVYNFAWLDDAIEILAHAGLKIVMCTPTATPPPWLLHMHPDILRVERNGVRISPGGRRHSCANVPAYQEASRAIVNEIATRYGSHPAVIGWQIDNEFGCGETTRCHCDHCRNRFHEWLENRYGTLEALNEAWGTQFWGMTYTAWEQIPVPGITTEPQSPSMRLDYYRFSSDSWRAFGKMQIDILRQRAPQQWITHNFMISHWSLDYWQLAEDLDFVSYDNYPHGIRDEIETAMNLDLMWSLKRRPFWIMEQQPGPVNWHPYHLPVPDGQVRLWTHQAVAHGADGVVYFRYRAARSGQEQYHGGLHKWDGSRDRTFYEAQAVAQDTADVPVLMRPARQTGIFLDYNDLWALELEAQHADFRYWDLVYDLYRMFWQANEPVDFVRRGAELDDYRTLVLPAGLLIQPDDAARLTRWVENGGRLIMTFRTHVRSLSSVSTDQPIPAELSTLAGVTIGDSVGVPPEHFTRWPHHRPGTGIQMANHTTDLRYHLWAETLEPTTATTIATYRDGLFADKPAITRNQVGAGEVIYVGCWVEDFGTLAELMGWATPDVSGLERVTLHGEDNSCWQLTLNHSLNERGDLAGLDVRYQRMNTED